MYTQVMMRRDGLGGEIDQRGREEVGMGVGRVKTCELERMRGCAGVLGSLC